MERDIMNETNILPNKSKRQLLALTLLVSAGGARAGATPAKEQKTVLVEQTYLKAKPGRRADLIRFIELNWYAMDRKGMDAGIFTSFRLLEEIDENKDWDLVMAVGYPNLMGYEEPATKARFKSIRSAHQEILVDGLGLKDLGEIVKHHRLRIRDGGMPSN
jgi:hypothetical protein